MKIILNAHAAQPSALEIKELLERSGEEVVFTGIIPLEMLAAYCRIHSDSIALVLFPNALSPAVDDEVLCHCLRPVFPGKLLLLRHLRGSLLHSSLTEWGIDRAIFSLDVERNTALVYATLFSLLPFTKVRAAHPSASYVAKGEMLNDTEEGDTVTLLDKKTEKVAQRIWNRLLSGQSHTQLRRDLYGFSPKSQRMHFPKKSDPESEVFDCLSQSETTVRAPEPFLDRRKCRLICGRNRERYDLSSNATAFLAHIIDGQGEFVPSRTFGRPDDCNTYAREINRILLLSRSGRWLLALRGRGYAWRRPK